MNLALTHTEPFDFCLDSLSNNIAPYYAIKLTCDERPKIFYAEQDQDDEDFIWLIDEENAEILDRDSEDLIEAWEPIWTHDFTIQHVN